ncbi:MAG: alanine racemase [Candidatus Paceibacterota bacterium]
MKDFFRRLAKARYPYEPLIKIEISRSRLLHNLHEFQKISTNRSIAPVLKSNAYGHGLVEVARILEKERVLSGPEDLPFFAVDSYFEAISLRRSGIRTPLLVIGYTPPETICHSRLRDVSFAVTSLYTLHFLIGQRLPIFSKPKTIHLKIDTGMRRQGILHTEINEAIKLIKDNPNINIEGIFSHFSDADNPDTTFTQNQIAVWNIVEKLFRVEFPGLKYTHLSNTDGHRFAKNINANVSRLGLGLYGLLEGTVFPQNIYPEPVLEMRTTITSTKILLAGETVGYSNTFKASKDMTIATIPVGYYEGLDRRLSGKGTLLVGPGRIPCPIVGRISMNIASIDVSSVTNPRVGMEVIVISKDRKDPNSLENLAHICGTITYEGSVIIPAHLKRIVI